MSFNGECSDRLFFVMPSRAIAYGLWHSKFGQRPTVDHRIRFVTSSFAKKVDRQARIFRFVVGSEIYESLPNKLGGLSAAINQTANKGWDERLIASRDWMGMGHSFQLRREIDAESGLSVILASTNASIRTTAPQYRRLPASRIIKKPFRAASWRVTRSRSHADDCSKYFPVQDQIRGPTRAGTAALALAANSNEAIARKNAIPLFLFFGRAVAIKFRRPDRSLSSVLMMQ
jgi:hypothetical protein